MNYDVFDQLCRDKGTTPTALSRKLGLSKGNTSSWKKDGNPSVEVLIKIADELDCTTDELIRERKDAAKTSDISLASDEKELLSNYRKSSRMDKARIQERAMVCAENAAESNEEPHITTIKLFDSAVSAGTGLDIDYTTSEDIEVSEDTEGADFAVRVSGDSMEPRFYSGDIVLVESTPSVEIGEIGIFILNGQAFIKELGRGELISLNKRYDPLRVKEDDSIYCQGRVIKVLNMKKGA